MLGSPLMRKERKSESLLPEPLRAHQREMILGANTILHGTLHAVTQTLATGAVVDISDKVAHIDPVNTLAWPVKYPSGTGAAVTVASGSLKTLSRPVRQSIVNGTGNLTLKTGTYYLSDFDVEASGKVTLDQAAGAVLVYVNGTLVLRGGFATLVAGGAPELLIG